MRRREGKRSAARALAWAAMAAALAMSTLAVGCGQANPGTVTLGAAALPVSRSSHIVVVVLENAEYGEVIGSSSAPYVNSLARRYGLMTRSYAIRHPSLPNYLALTSGSTQGIESDCTDCAVSARNIVDQLEGAGISWKAYLEDAPRPCFLGASSGGYAKKHNPFAYFTDIVRSPSRCARLTGFAQLAADLRTGHLPTYAWISPNLCDDGHDCGVGAADRFLARSVPALLRELGPHGFVVLQWDEGTSDEGCCGVAKGGHIATIVAGPQVRKGARSPAAIDHYGVLGSVEEALGLPPLGGAADARSGRLTKLFAQAPHVR
ncbi:MAG TPA: alkaline phosphatase family protein [Solirubrobacteraceae bacterium]|jgi:phospholipase C|nr:alkaline phosphatase family protein [Solirubrobacteraceae bacterium]